MRKIFSLILMLVMAVGAVSAADGFYTSGTKLMDANGNEFVMRGCNYSPAIPPASSFPRGGSGAGLPVRPWSVSSAFARKTS